MNEGQNRDFERLMFGGASWLQAMDYCLNNPLGYSRREEINAHLATVVES